jgi:putative DNA primase/helicase
MTSTDLRDAATGLLARQWSVIPLRPKDKTPVIDSWKPYQKERPAAAQVLTWWRKWPDANIGLITGAVSGLIVLDLDSPEARADAEACGLPRTPTVKTGKGWHVYFAHPGGEVRNFARKRPGMDLRGDGGYVVGAGSIHPSGSVYGWEISPDECNLAPVPEWLMAMIRPNTTPPVTGGNGRGPAAGGDRTDRYAAAALAGELQALAGATEGTRNQQLNDSAFALGGLIGAGALERTTVEDELFRAALGTGLGEQEAQRTIKSGLDAGEKQPREIPDRPAQRSTRARQAPPPQTPEDGEPETPPTASEHLTDLGNARRLVAGHGQDLRYCNPWGQWLAWDTMRWAPDDTQEVVRRAKATVGSIYAEAAGADEDGRKAIAKHAMRSEGGQRIREMLKLAESEPGIPILPGDLDADPWLFNVLNGTLDLQTGQLRAHRRGDMLTKIAPVFYEPDADCPTWLAFLERIMAGDQDLIAYLQRVIGYGLTGDTSEQALFVFHGTGANGKSTFLEAIHEMLGQDYALRIRTETLMVKQGDAVPSDIARLRGARLVSAQETEEGKRLAESLVKSLTGGDTVTARFMRQNEFQFKPEFKLFVASNHKPTIRGTDYAMWRRIRLVPFAVTIPEAEQDRQLCHKLQSELSGILAWAVRGCLAWQREGLGMPAAVRSATETYRAESDILAAFLDERTTTAPEVAAGQLYEAYKAWAESNGEHAMTGQMFGRRMAERGFDKYRRGSLTYYLGLGLLV